MYTVAKSGIRKVNKASIVAAIFGGALLFSPGCFAQAAADKGAFQEEQQMLRDDNVQEQQLEQQKEIYEKQAEAADTKDEPYRLYAEKRVTALTKLKKAGGSPSRSLSQDKELYALEHWLQADAATKEAETAHVQQLNQAIANLQSQQSQTMASMNQDIQGLKMDGERAYVDSEEDRKFNQQMQINNFNELQSEMGWMTNGAPPRFGTFGGSMMGGFGGYGGGMGGAFGLGNVRGGSGIGY